MSRWKWLLDELRMSNWILLLLLAAVIDYYFLTNNLFRSTDLVTINSILVAAAGIMYQVQATNEREMKSRVHQQKRETYIQLTEFLAKFFENVKKRGPSVDPTTIVDQGEWFSLNFKIGIFASKEVIRSFNNIRHPDVKQNAGEWGIIQLGTLFKQMRKEVSSMEGEVSARELLSLWMTDAYESKYDEIFRRLN
jgi:hypothetical protein